MTRHWTRSFVIGAVVAAMCLIGGALTAQEQSAVRPIELGPAVGTKVPPFSAPDQDGRMQTLDTVRGPKGTLLLFFRSADW